MKMIVSKSQRCFNVFLKCQCGFSRLLEELQRTEESNLESEKQEMEVRYKALTDISDTYKHLEEELVGIPLLNL